MKRPSRNIEDLFSHMSSVMAVLGVLAGAAFFLIRTSWGQKMFSFLNGTAASLMFEIAITSFVALMSLAFMAFWIRTLQSNPYPLKVALLGAPQAGKTIYLTMLFRQLASYTINNVSFQPYGLETIEAVSRNVQTLAGGFWLKPTSEDSVFFFRANAVVGKSFFRRRYTVEIGDYAGEKMAEFDSSSDRWLHRTEYFKYAVGCDILFLAIDGGILASGRPEEIEDMQLKLIAALQVLIEARNVRPERKMRAPVGLLVLKSDLLLPIIPDRIDRETFIRSYAKEKLGRLIDLCNQRCQNFAIFPVAAIGYVKIENSIPPKKIDPECVVTPMAWALNKFRKAGGALIS